MKHMLMFFLIVFSFLPGVVNAQTGWTVQNAGISSLIRSIKSVNRNVGWIAADGGVIRRTSDGGVKWDTIPSPTTAATSIAPVDSLTAVIAHYGPSAIIYRTTNGGVSWISVFDQPGGYIDALLMVDENNGFALGDPVNGHWTVLKTTNGGVTWQHLANEPAQIGGEDGWTQAFCTIGTRNLWFGSGGARIYRSTDGGGTWSWSPTHYSRCSAVVFADTLNGVAGFGDGSGAFSSDGGVNWTPMTIPGSGSMIWGLATDGAQSFWAPKPDTVFVSITRGQTWLPQFASPLGGYLRDVHFSRDGSVLSGWLGSSTGGVARYVGEITSLGIDQDVPPSAFVLNQNYPNPFNPSTMISYSLPHSTDVTLTIHNMLGQQVAILVNEYKSAGTYQQTWNAGALASGVYLYRLTTGTFRETKKLVLVK
jgi:photosystem II stability/assembly factor-like uncharacterized protein